MLIWRSPEWISYLGVGQSPQFEELSTVVAATIKTNYAPTKTATEDAATVSQACLPLAQWQVERGSCKYGV